MVVRANNPSRPLEIDFKMQLPRDPTANGRLNLPFAVGFCWSCWNISIVFYSPPVSL